MSILVSVAFSAACAIGASPLQDADIEKAISMISKELLQRHHEVRCWDSVDPSNGWLSKHKGGITALTTLALLSSGHSSNSPYLQRALDYIWEVQEPSSYVLTLRTSIWAQLPDTFKRRLAKDTKRLIDTLSLQFGGWGIDATAPHSRTETSPLTREFGVIALREAYRRGQSIPKICWRSIANATLKAQHKDGGWSYAQSATSGDSSSNMTVAGLNCLLGVDEIYGDELSDADSELIQSSINIALQWIDKHATTKTNSGGTALMSYLYALERAAMSCGLSEIRNHDWFRDGASAVIKTHCGVRKAKGSTVNLSFALLFLTRGKSPIALSEFVTHKGEVDPHRVADTITKNISERTEQSLSWKLITNEEHVQSWLTAPLLLIQDINTVPEDTRKFKEFLDYGGLLVMLATGKELRTCVSFANKLCPTLNVTKTQRSHWSHDFIENASGVWVHIWNDGIRDRILVIQGDGKKLVRSKNSKLSKLMTNLCCGAAELEKWASRLKNTTRPLSIKPFVFVEHSGKWDAEIAVAKQRKLHSLPWEKVFNKSYVWVGGINADEVTPQLVKNIISTASSGSTVLVESIGGHGKFASRVQSLCTENFGVKISVDTRLEQITQRRGWSIRNHKKLPAPRIASIGKGNVIFIDCDIRNALLGQTAWGIHGYSSEAAEELIQRLLCK